VAKISIARAALPHLTVPTTSIGDGSREPRLARLYCWHPLSRRSVALAVPVDARTARQIRMTEWLRWTVLLIAVVFLVFNVTDLVLSLRDQDRVRPMWAIGLSLAFTALMLFMAGWQIAHRHIPAGTATRESVELSNVHPAAAQEWVRLNPAGVVLVTDWQGAWIQPAQPGQPAPPAQPSEPAQPA
jgi:hypothetical protein